MARDLKPGKGTSMLWDGGLASSDHDQQVADLPSQSTSECMEPAPAVEAVGARGGAGVLSK